jgi:hypothetical protein
MPDRTEIFTFANSVPPLAVAVLAVLLIVGAGVWMLLAMRGND